MYYFIPFLFALLFPIPSWAACSGYPAGVAGTDWIEALSGTFSAGQKDHMINLHGANGLAGMLTYDPSDNDLKLCDGTNWNSLAVADGASLWSQSGSDVYYNSGNVGVGTTSPGEKLVIGNHAFAFHDGGSEVFAFSGDYQSPIWVRQNGAAYQGQISFSPTNGSFTIYSTNTDDNSGDFTNKFLTLQGSTGNVGIGTGSPVTKLDIAAVNGTAEGAEIKLRGAAASLDWNFDVFQDDLRIFKTSQGSTGNFSQKMRVTDAGVVQIGGNGISDGLFIEPQGTFMRMAFDELRLYEWGGAGDVLTISDGNVGVSIATPNEKLHITGNAVIEGLDIYFTHDGATDGNNEYFHFGDDNSVLGVANGVMSLWADTNRERADWQNSTAALAAAAGYFKDRLAVGNTDSTNKITFTGIGDVTGANSGGGLLLEDSSGDATGWKLRIDANEMQVSKDGTANSLSLNPFGGRVAIGANIDFKYTGGGDIITFENGGQPFIRKLTDRGGVRIGKDDSLIIGDGESPATVAANINPESELTYITSDNNVFVYTNLQNGWGSKQQFYFHENGGAYKSGGGSWAATSDARLKDIDGAYESGLDAIAALKPVRYHYKIDNLRGEPSDKEYIGLIAQQVQPHFPESVSLRDDGYFDLDTTSINFALINAIKELNQIVKKQSRQIEALQVTIEQ